MEHMNRIKDILDEKGIKQTWLAQKLGKSYNMINSYVKNRRQPSIEDLYKIAKILDVEAKDLLLDLKGDNLSDEDKIKIDRKRMAKNIVQTLKTLK